MNKKAMSNQAVSIYAEALKRQKEEAESAGAKNGASTSTQTSTRKATRESTLSRKGSRDLSRTPSRDTARTSSRKTARKAKRTSSRPKKWRPSRDLPTRNEIQEFSFHLRDELKVKVQAEVPHHWHGELEEIAHELNIKKLELYRFIIGEFLGKVRRKDTS